MDVVALLPMICRYNSQEHLGRPSIIDTATRLLYAKLKQDRARFMPTFQRIDGANMYVGGDGSPHDGCELLVNMKIPLSTMSSA